MKKIAFYKKMIIAYSILALLALAVNIFLIARPISYGMGYHFKDQSQGAAFEGAIKFNADGTMVLQNTNYSYEVESFYYYKNGYIFYTLAETQEEYEEEVSYINENFDEALNTPFYADRISAFKLTADGPDGYAIVYTCTQAIVYFGIGCAVELLLIVLVCGHFALYKRAKKEEQMVV